MNKDAGRGGWLIVMLRLESGEKLPFVLDTDSPFTVFDKSMEPKLGEHLDTGTFSAFGVAQKSDRYVAPKLYLGNTRLMTGSYIVTYDFKQQIKQFPSYSGIPVMGVLGMDVLKHYCIQLDFERSRMRFLDDKRANKKDWGTPFPLTDVGDGCFAIGENLVGAKGPGSLIDTGDNSHGCLTPKLFQQWTNQAAPPASGEARSPDGVLGGETYHDLDLQCLDKGDHASDSNFNTIGLYVLSENLVTLDFPDRTMYLKRTSNWPLGPNNIQAAVISEAKSAANSAAKFLKSLQGEGQLPGWSKNDDAQGTVFHFMYSHNLVNSVAWDIQKTGDTSTYHYTVIRASKDSSWKLQNAWRTDQNGHTIEQYPVP